MVMCAFGFGNNFLTPNSIEYSVNCDLFESEFNAENMFSGIQWIMQIVSAKS